jgi:hypothetical protein
MAVIVASGVALVVLERRARRSKTPDVPLGPVTT